MSSSLPVRIGKISALSFFCLFLATTLSAQQQQRPDPEPGPGAQDRVRFEVALTLGQTWTDNPAFVQGFNQSDSINDIGLDIPYVLRRPTYDWNFRYNPTYRRYQDFDDLSFLEHLLATSVVGQPSPRTQYEVWVAYLLTQSQNVSPDFLDEATFLTNRTDRESLTGTVMVSREVAPRWRVRGRARARQLQLEEISGFDAGVMPAQLGDQLSTEVGAGAIYQKSERTSIDFGYDVREFDVDLGGDETIHALRVGANTQVSPETTLSYAVGLADRDGRNQRDETEYELSAAIAHQVKRGLLTARTDRRARNGDAIGGASTVSSVALRYAEMLGRRTRWDVSADWSLREPVDSSLDDLKLLRGSVSLIVRGTGFDKGWIRQGLGLRFRGSLVDQSGGDLAELESSYYVVSAALMAFFSN